MDGTGLEPRHNSLLQNLFHSIIAVRRMRGKPVTSPNFSSGLVQIRTADLFYVKEAL